MEGTSNPSTVPRDHYELLSVSKDSSDQEIKTTRRKLALEYHSKKNSSNPERSKLDDDLNERREAAIAAAAALQPKFQSASITKDQLNKFKELHKRRLQIKAGSKIQKSSQGKRRVSKNAYVKEEDAKNNEDEDINVMLKGSGVAVSKGNTYNISPLQQEKIVTHMASKKRQKLHWGLDTKERWERKANM